MNYLLGRKAIQTPGQGIQLPNIAGDLQTPQQLRKSFSRNALARLVEREWKFILFNRYYTKLQVLFFQILVLYYIFVSFMLHNI